MPLLVCVKHIEITYENISAYVPWYRYKDVNNSNQTNDIYSVLILGRNSSLFVNDRLLCKARGY